MPDPAPATHSRVDVLVRTFNSAASLEACLRSARASLPVERLLVVDRESTDETRTIALRFGAEFYPEDVGLGRATRLAIEKATSEYVVFLDSDVTVRRTDFCSLAIEKLSDPRVAAVVGGASGHRFLYGLPLSLTVFRRSWIADVAIPSEAQGRETYYIQRALRRGHRRVVYVPDAMEHRSVYRTRNWPEWQGAQTRLAAGMSARELVYSAMVILLIHMNSKRAKDLVYTPVFFGKFLRGFLSPARWRVMDRRLASRP